MPTPINKTLHDAQILTRKVNTALAEHAIPASLALDVQRQLQEKPPYQKDAFLSRVGDSLKGSLITYSDAQELLQREEGEDGDARDERDETAEALRVSTSLTARSIETTFGRKVLIKMSLAGTVPSAADTLNTFVKAFINATSAEDFAPPAPINPHVAFNFAAARAEIVAQHAALQAALTALTTEERQSQQARSDRDVALAAWRQELRFARDEARSILIRAGKDDLAARILPTDRQIDGAEPIEDDGPAGPGEGQDTSKSGEINVG